MGRKSSSVPRILAVLIPYLERKDLEFSSNCGNAPTIPVTAEEGKVNVAKLVRELQAEPGGDSIKAYDSQHFYDPDVGAVVNAFAASQGVKPIGIRSLANKDDDVVVQEMARQKGSMKAEHEAYLEAIAEITRLRRELDHVKTRIQFVQEHGVLLRHPRLDFD
jgi:hypothetical protein